MLKNMHFDVFAHKKSPRACVYARKFVILRPNLG